MISSTPSKAVGLMALAPSPQKLPVNRHAPRAIAQRLVLSIVPLPMLALAEAALPMTACLWLAGCLYACLIAWGRGGTLIKVVEIGAATTLCSLALVTLTP
jgi:hypothetical protein